MWEALGRAGYAEYGERGWHAVNVPVCRAVLSALWPDEDFRYLDDMVPNDHEGVPS
jgi:hypothetical protein